MSSYQTILAAVDSTDEAKEILGAAVRTAQDHGAQLHVMTVIRPLNYTYTGFESAGISQAMANFEMDATSSAQGQLDKLAEPLGIEKECLHVALGRPADEIKSMAQQIDANLIVVGSHGRHGLGLILGSTANGILHGSPCDVLTVRIAKSD